MALRSISLWKGFHSSELKDLLDASWRDEKLLILCPPLLSDFRFLSALPTEKLRFHGEWKEAERAAAEKAVSHGSTDPMVGEQTTNALKSAILGVFTSGTAGGAPRLVLYSKENIEASLSAILELFDEKRIDAIFCYPQPFHTFGLTLGYLQAILRRKKFISLQGRYTSAYHSEWFESARKFPGMLTLGTPTHFQDLLKWVRAGVGKPSPTYSSNSGGAPTSVALWRAMRDELNIEAPSVGYGCTEASPGLTHLPPGVEPYEDGEIGQLLSGVKLRLEPGKGLIFSGPQKCLAIVKDGGLEFPGEILLKDHLENRASDRFVFKGRYDLVFNRGGVKFSLEEIESFLRGRFPIDCMAVAVSDERLGEDLGVLWKSESGKPEGIAASDLVAALREKFSAHFDEKKFRSIDAFPLNASAKLDRKAGATIFSPTSASKAKSLLSLEEVQSIIPHRPPFLWVDEVHEANLDGGLCRVIVKKDAPYLDENGEVRRSSFLEWMAQSYAFIRGALGKSGALTAATTTKRAFLVSIQDAVYPEKSSSEAKEYFVRLSDFREIGPITLFSGVVTNAEGDRTYCRARMKIFAD